MRYGRSAAVALLLLAGCGQQGAAPTASGPATAVASIAPDPSPRTAPYLVGASVLLWPAGPGPALMQRPCQTRDVNATAVTKTIVGGVAGVLHLTGTGCSLHISQGPQQLVAADGRMLAVRTDDTPPATNPPRVPRDDLPLAAGNVLWGFTWTGSWCGPRAAGIVIVMKDDPGVNGDHGSYGAVRAPLTGPQPACVGDSDAVLRPGIAGNPADDQGPVAADAVLPVPPAWAGLRGGVTIPSTVTDAVPAFTYTLTNRTDLPIPLSPCPEYSTDISAGHPGSYGHSSITGEAPLPCRAADNVVPAHGSLRFTLKGANFDQGLPHPYPNGSVVTVEVAIAGVATAKAAAHVG